MKIEEYRKRLTELLTPKDSGIILIEASKDDDISKKEYVELVSTQAKAMIEWYRSEAEENKVLTKKELYIKELENAHAVSTISEILQRVNSDNLEWQEIIDIQYIAIQQLKEMVVRM